MNTSTQDIAVEDVEQTEITLTIQTGLKAGRMLRSVVQLPAYPPPVESPAVDPAPGGPYL